MYAQAPHRISKLLIPRWFLSFCLNNLNVLNVISLSLPVFLLSPLFIASYLSLPAENTRALAGCWSQNVDLTLHLFSCPFPPSHHSFLISDTLLGFRSLNISPNSHLDRGKQRMDYGGAQTSPFCCLCRTAYSVRYRQVSKAAPSSHFYPECCPGWRRLHSHHCNQGNHTRCVTV